MLVTDSMEAAGMGDGEYGIAGNRVTVKNSKAVTLDGKLAGSTLDMLDAVKNLAEYAQISFAEALYSATAASAKMLGIYDRVGSLDKGKRADFLVFDGDFNIRQVYFGGKRTEFEKETYKTQKKGTRPICRV